MSEVAPPEIPEFDHPDYPEGAILVAAPYPQHLRDQVVLDSFDNEIKDGDSEAACSFKYDEAEGEIFHGTSEREIATSEFWEVYPHDIDIEPVLFYNPGPSSDEDNFLKDAILQTLGVTRD